MTRDTKAGFGSKINGIAMTLEGAKKLTTEQRTEFKQRATQVVSGIQIKKLTEVLDILADSVFDDYQKKYYILIDLLISS